MQYDDAYLFRTSKPCRVFCTKNYWLVYSCGIVVHAVKNKQTEACCQFYPILMEETEIYLMYIYMKVRRVEV